MRRFAMTCLALSLSLSGAAAETRGYSWPKMATAAHDTIEQRFAPPSGFVREPSAAGTFGAWLRGLPLLERDAPVLLFTGARKPRQDVHAGVIDIDVGRKDLQQCADAIMRLRAEYLWASGRATSIAFNDTGGGQPMRWSSYAAGERPRPEGRRLVWSRSAPADQSYGAFRRYLDTVFVWAGTHSLEKELAPVTAGPVQIGDVVIRGGFPGHAVLVVDVARHPTTGERRVLYAQSFMPAQNFHVLKSAADPTTAWAPEPTANQPVVTPEWLFPAGSLRRWR